HGRVRRRDLRDVGYTLGVAATGATLTFAIAIPVCGWLRARAFGPVEFLLKVPLFVPFVVVGHALRVFLAPWAPGLAGSWTGIALALAWKHLGLAALGVVGYLMAMGAALVYLKRLTPREAAVTRLKRRPLE